MLALTLGFLLYTTPITPTIPIVYEQLNNTFTVSYTNLGQIFLVTVYKNGGGITAIFFDEGVDVEYVFINASTIEEIFFNMVVDGKFWKIQPKIIPLVKNHLPAILNE